MELKEQDLVAIENYWKNQFSDKEKIAFENRLKVDKPFATTFRQVNILKQGITYHHLYQKLADLKQIETEYQNSQESKKETVTELIIDATRLSKNQELLHQFQDLEDQLENGTITHSTEKETNNNFPWKVAAGFLFLCVASFLIYLNQTSINPQRLATTLFETYPHQYAIRDDKTSSIKNAFNQYDFGEFSKAIPLMEQIATENTNAIFDFHLAIAYLGNKEIDKAILTFEKVGSALPNMQEQINWYLGLCYLQKGEIDSARKYFSQIQYYKQTTIQELLKQLG